MRTKEIITFNHKTPITLSLFFFFFNDRLAFMLLTYVIGFAFGVRSASCSLWYVFIQRGERFAFSERYMSLFLQGSVVKLS